MQHGATSSTTGSASPPAASGRTSPPAAKNTAAGAMTAARTADDFRRSVANSCLPTDSTIEETASCTASFEDPNVWREDRSGGGVVGSPALGCYNSDAYSLTPPNPRRTHFRSSAAPMQSQRRPVGSAFKVGGDAATSSARRPGCFPGVAENSASPGSPASRWPPNRTILFRHCRTPWRARGGGGGRSPAPWTTCPIPIATCRSWPFQQPHRRAGSLLRHAAV